MSIGPKQTRQSGTEHINKPEITQAYKAAQLDADRAENVNEVPQHLKVPGKGTSRSGIAKQLPKGHDKNQTEHLNPGQPGPHQGLTTPRNMDDPKHAQGTESIRKQFL